MWSRSCSVLVVLIWNFLQCWCEQGTFFYDILLGHGDNLSLLILSKPSDLFQAYLRSTFFFLCIIVYHVILWVFIHIKLVTCMLVVLWKPNCCKIISALRKCFARCVFQSNITCNFEVSHAVLAAFYNYWINIYIACGI